MLACPPGQGKHDTHAQATKGRRGQGARRTWSVVRAAELAARACQQREQCAEHQRSLLRRRVRRVEARAAEMRCGASDGCGQLMRRRAGAGDAAPPQGLHRAPRLNHPHWPSAACSGWPAVSRPVRGCQHSRRRARLLNPFPRGKMRPFPRGSADARSGTRALPPHARCNRDRWPHSTGSVGRKRNNETCTSSVSRRRRRLTKQHPHSIRAAVPQSPLRAARGCLRGAAAVNTVTPPPPNARC